MRSEIHDHPEGYRTASRPDALPVTVTTVRRDEYAEPMWVARLKERLREAFGGPADVLDDEP